MKSLSSFVVAVVVAFSCLNCSSSTTSGSGTDAGSTAPTSAGGRTGVTACGDFPDGQPKSCQAGQHCTDEGLSKCDTGCLTDNNCPQTATCLVSSGACQSSAPAASTVSCDDFCKHAMACSPTLTAAHCAQLCAGYNDTCKSCLLNANCSAPASTCDVQCH